MRKETPRRTRAREPSHREHPLGPLTPTELRRTELVKDAKGLPGYGEAELYQPDLEQGLIPFAGYEARRFTFNESSPGPSSPFLVRGIAWRPDQAYATIHYPIDVDLRINDRDIVIENITAQIVISERDWDAQAAGPYWFKRPFVLPPGSDVEFSSSTSVNGDIYMLGEFIDLIPKREYYTVLKGFYINPDSRSLIRLSKYKSVVYHCIANTIHATEHYINNYHGGTYILTVNDHTLFDGRVNQMALLPSAYPSAADSRYYSPLVKFKPWVVDGGDSIEIYNQNSDTLMLIFEFVPEPWMTDKERKYACL